MNRLSFFLVLILLFVSTTGASIIDKETKQGVLGLDQKFERLSRQQQELRSEELKFHGEEARLLKEQSEIIKKLISKIETLEKQSKQIQQTVNQPPKPVVVVQPAPATPVVTPPVQVAAPPVSVPVKQSIEPTPPPPAPIPDKPQIQVKPSSSPPPPPAIFSAPVPVVSEPSKPTASNNDSLSLLALFFSGVSGLFMIIILTRLVRGENRMKKLIWKSEMEFLRDEMIHGRPQLKIVSDGAGIELVNAGDAEAVDIRIFVGPAPATMKQKVKTNSKMSASERIEIPLQPSLREGPIYASLEYKNPASGKVYKEQFVLKIDRLTGQLSPIQEAS